MNGEMQPPQDVRAGEGTAAPSRLVRSAALVLGAWRTVAMTALVAMVVALALHYLLPRHYTARMLLSVSQPQSDTRMSAMLPGQMAALLPALSGTSSDVRLVTTLLRSQSLADSMQRRFPGVGITAVQLPADGSINVEVRHRNPRTAAAAANAYPDILNRTLVELNAQKRLRKQAVLQDQVRMARRDLDSSQEALVEFERSHHVPAVEEQAKQTVQAGGALQQAIAEKEVAVAVLRRVATPDNPELRAAEAELAGMRQQLTGMSEGRSGGFLLPMNASPELKANGLRLLGEYTKDQQAYLSLLAALTQSQIESADNLPVVTVVDSAAVPGVPTGPGPLTVAEFALILGVLAAVAYVLAADGMRIAGMDPRYAPLFLAASRVRRELGLKARRTGGPDESPAPTLATTSAGLPAAVLTERVNGSAGAVTVPAPDAAGRDRS